jgi:Trk K+ transport system NAD-binding subunit
MLRVPETWAARTIVQLVSAGDFPQHAVISGIYRPSEDRFVMPRGDSEVRPGDQLFVSADINDLREAAVCFGLKPPRSLRPRKRGKS